MTQTLDEARDFVLEHLEEGVDCPACGQTAREYRRSMTATCARVLLALYRQDPAFVHLPTLAAEQLPDVAHQGGYLTLAHYWQLIEEEPTVREDGGRAGYWRLTAAGRDFVEHRCTVPRYAHIFNGRRRRYSGVQVSITAVLGARFDYNALVRGERDPWDFG